MDAFPASHVLFSNVLDIVCRGFPIAMVPGYPKATSDPQILPLPHLLHAVAGFVHAIRHSPSVVTGRRDGCLLLFCSAEDFSGKTVGVYYLFRLSYLPFMWLRSP